MAKCKSCAAPLPSNTSLCSYCGTRNDVDLKGVHQYTVKEPDSERVCPRCEKSLSTIDLNVEGEFYIERCEQCMGLFFDPNELQVLLEKSVSNVFEIDYERLNTVNKELRHNDYSVTYIKCPVCGQLMNRVNFGKKSGVIVDRCREHGIWLDGGELRHLLEWKKAGGQILDDKQEERRRQRLEQQRRQQEARAFADTGRNGTGRTTSDGNSRGNWSSTDYHDDEDIIDIIFSTVRQLFW